MTLTANTDPGYTFADLSGDLSDSDNPETIVMEGNHSVTANFVAEEYNLEITVSPNSSGTVSKNPYQTTYSYDDEVILTANPALGYEFSHWSGDVNSTINPYNLTILDDVTVTANFIESTYSLETYISPTGKGSITIDPDKDEYQPGETISLTADPIDGYSFVNWSGDQSSSTNPYSFQINENTSITANFTEIIFSTKVFIPIVLR